MKHLNILVSGKVQGVFFRASTKEKADQLGLKGFVRNEPNGCVYIEVVGENNVLEIFLRWCKQGPEGACVDHLDITEVPLKNMRSFEVKR